MSERLTVEQVADLADVSPLEWDQWQPTLARDVLASRKLIADLRAWLTKMDGGHCERLTGGGYTKDGTGSRCSCVSYGVC